MQGDFQTASTWDDYAEALAFTGNSLLAPMNQTSTVALDPAFWEEFPGFGDEGVAAALADCRAYAQEAQDFVAGGGNAVQRASVEFTKLFVGPPRPATSPWETMYGAGAGSDIAGFGEPTFQMQQLLREEGLEVSNENNQYADHIGIELLLASVLAQRAAEALNELQLENDLEKFRWFAHAHPLAWAGELAAAAEQVAPGGFIPRMLRLGIALLNSACHQR